MGGNTSAGMELWWCPLGEALSAPPHPLGRGWVTSASQARGKELLGDHTEDIQGLLFPGICPTNVFSLHFPAPRSVLLAPEGTESCRRCSAP